MIKIWVAKDDDGKIYAYSDEPNVKVNGRWGCSKTTCFAEIPLDDIDVPMEIELEKT